MPTVLREGPFLFFYSGDRHEPPHVNVERGMDQAKFWLGPVRRASSRGFSAAESRRIERIVAERANDFLRAWDEYFAD